MLFLLSTPKKSAKFSNKKTLAEKLGIKKFDNELSKKSDYYNDKLLYENKKN